MWPCYRMIAKPLFNSSNLLFIICLVHFRYNKFKVYTDYWHHCVLVFAFLLFIWCVLLIMLTKILTIYVCVCIRKKNRFLSRWALNPSLYTIIALVIMVQRVIRLHRQEICGKPKQVLNPGSVLAAFPRIRTPTTVVVSRPWAAMENLLFITTNEVDNNKFLWSPSVIYIL